MSNSKASVLRTILAPDIIDNIENHIRPHCLSLIQRGAREAHEECTEELRQRLEISAWHVENSAMTRYRRLVRPVFTLDDMAESGCWW